MTFDIADRDILLKEAETFFGEGRIGDAIDRYKELADTGDWRGYQGLLDAEAGAGLVNPNWLNHTDWISSAIAFRQDRFADPASLRALYPAGFSVTGTVKAMEYVFGRCKSCMPLIDAAKGAPYNHPYVAIEAVASALPGEKKRTKVAREFVYEFAGMLGVNRETTNNLLQNKGFHAATRS